MSLDSFLRCIIGAPDALLTVARGAVLHFAHDIRKPHATKATVAQWMFGRTVKPLTPPRKRTTVGRTLLLAQVPKRTIVAFDVNGHVSPSFASWQHQVPLVAAMISAEYRFAVNVRD